MARLGLRGRREDRLGELLRFDERLRKLLAGDRSERLVLSPGGTRDVPARHALDVDALAVLHEDGAAGDRLRVLEGSGETAKIGGDEVVRHDLLGLAEPEVRELGEHAALIRDRRGQNGVERREPIARDDDQLVAAGLVDIADLTATEEGGAVDPRFEEDAHSGRMPLRRSRQADAMSRATSGARPRYSSGRSRMRLSSGVNFTRYGRRSPSSVATSRSEREPRSASRVSRRTVS